MMIGLVLIAALMSIGLISAYLDSKQSAKLEAHLLSLPVILKNNIGLL
ncbi:hypothetical protein BLGI_3514 [Brevibacillus laterosporus GI-9]|nr:hypothetical protein BLGI_3514 [Brevibacillus laterosporus GI-9]